MNLQNQFMAASATEIDYELLRRSNSVHDYQTELAAQLIRKSSEYKRPSQPVSEEVYTNEQGGMQSAIGVAYHLLPPKALNVVARVFEEGARKYAPDNWKLIPTEEHINHLVNHSFKHLEGDTTEEHLAHTACRSLMALEMYLAGKK